MLEQRAGPPPTPAPRQRGVGPEDRLLFLLGTCQMPILLETPRNAWE